MKSKTGSSLDFPKAALDFPNRFGQYLKDVGEIMEKDWPSTFMEDDLEEFARTMRKDTFGMATFHRASPRYEVLDSPDKFEVQIDVPDFTPEEISIDLKAGGRILSVIGSHEEKDEGHMMTSKFQQNFTLDPSIMTNELVADLKDKKLTITAPRMVDRLPESRKVEMLINGKPVKQMKAKSSAKKDKTKKEKGNKDELSA